MRIRLKPLPDRFRKLLEKSKGIKPLEAFQIVVGIVISVSTLAISWKTSQLSELTGRNNQQLQHITHQLSESRFGFDRLREIYDRTEKFLADQHQNEKRGKALVVLIKALPDDAFRRDLLVLVLAETSSMVVAATAAHATSAIEGTSQPRFDPQKLDKNSFFGMTSFKLNADGYTLTVAEPFGFKDSKGMIWEVPKGFVSDGASLPRAFWSITGPPLSGSLTPGAVLHDYYVTNRTRPVDDVSRMFFEAMIKSGVSSTTANMIYAAVRYSGPRWEVRTPPN